MREMRRKARARDVAFCLDLIDKAPETDEQK